MMALLLSILVAFFLSNLDIYYLCWVSWKVVDHILFMNYNLFGFFFVCWDTFSEGTEPTSHNAPLLPMYDDKIFEFDICVWFFFLSYIIHFISVSYFASLLLLATFLNTHLCLALYAKRTFAKTLASCFHFGSSQIEYEANYNPIHVFAYNVTCAKLHRHGVVYRGI